MKKLGIIQTRGLGDIVIALPIARWYADQGWHPHWPICEQWVEQMTAVAPWVKWIPITPDHGPFFWDTPMERLKNFKCDEIICLYQALTGHPEFSSTAYFQHTGFDQYKYIAAGVPFLEKWNLARCITRNLEREQALYDRVVKNPNYVVAHLQSSEHRVDLDPALIPEGWDLVEITNEGWIFDWLTVIERAQSIVMTDSCMSNLVDQLGLGDDRYYIPLHHIGLTPVFGQHWHWLENPRLSPQARTIGVGR